MPANIASATDQQWAQRRLETVHNSRRRLVAHLAAGKTTDLADAPLCIDASVYTDPERFAAEKHTLFTQTPLVAGLSGDIPEPGDVMLFDQAGPAIIVTRDRDGEVHAFLNSCPHRGSKLVMACGNHGRITCPFHAWTFDLTGKLVGVPGREGFEDAARNLTRVPAAEWNGLIFVKPTPGDEQLDIDAFLGDFAPEVAQLEMQRARPVKSGILDVKANWKYALDTYGESYHFARTHAKTLAPYFISNVMACDQFGANYRITFPDVGLLELVDKPESEWPVIDFSAVHYLFPNTILFIGSTVPGKWYFQVFRHFPGATPGVTHTHFAVYAPKDAITENYDDEVAQAFDSTAEVVRTEDYFISANGWDALSRSPGASVVFGRNEIALQGAQRHIAAAIGMPLPVVNR